MVLVVDKRVVKLLACMAIIVLLFSLTGCLTKAIEGDKKEDASLDPEVTTEVTELVEEDEEEIVDEDAVLEEEDKEVTNEAVPAKKVKVTLYFSDQAGSKLIAETREISSVEGLARATMEELIKGPTSSEAKATLPAGTKLLDINIKADGLGIVDLSRDLKGQAEGSTAELLRVYSIVNTFAQFDTVDQVQILVGSQKIDTLGGHVKISEPLKPDNSLVK